MSDDSKGSKVLVCATIILAAIVLVIFLSCLGLYFSGLFQQQQARTPLPDIAGELEKSKSLCEGHAATVKGLQRLPRGALTEGKDLYLTAKAEQDECIKYLQTAIDNGFTEKNARDGQAKQKKARGSAEAFVTWARKFETKHEDTGALPGLSDLLNLAKWFQENDDKAKQKLKDDLENCRIRSWANIPADPIGYVGEK